jgi:hypothetical protein
MGLGEQEEEQDQFAVEFETEDDKAEREAAQALVCSIYRNTKTGKALLILVNPRDSAVEENLVVREALLGKPFRTMRDVEVGQDIPQMRDQKKGGSVANTSAPIFVDRYQFRMIEVQ